ncbi:MAG: helix-turn-helix domain-containing protein [Deltaproteobacteria bacterium]|nr:helix-turn-helix domain-containing protein [Deltaproteobacteria bacterium]
MQTYEEIIIPNESRKKIKGLVPRGLRFKTKPSAKMQRCLVVLDLEKALSDMTTIFAERTLSRLVTQTQATLLSRRSISPTVVADVMVGLRRLIHNDPYVTTSEQAVRRLLLAKAHNAADRLIASVELQGETLFVWSCEPKLYTCSIKDIPVLAKLSKVQLANFEVSKSGSRINWPKADVDLDLGSIRYWADPTFRHNKDKELREAAKSYGVAIRELRLEKGLKQSDILGLSSRHVRRLEAGEGQPFTSTLEKLAAAHEMSLESYLDTLATRSASK